MVMMCNGRNGLALMYGMDNHFAAMFRLKVMPFNGAWRDSELLTYSNEIIWQMIDSFQLSSSAVITLRYGA